ncbi:MAG TPA: tripartite tricarboxylate transporter substrate binding protein [Burkholderiaceae bacterium]|nr:tripartite tricarboxylate transporter substrate binding protein [Burkholderiaceae bacterium]
MSRARYVLAFAALFALAASGTSARAAEYPTKPIRIVTPYAPGGTADIMARLVAKALTDAWGQSVVVENRAGAAGTIGTEVVAKAPADGYTLLAAYVTEIALAPRLYANVPYDPLKDLAPVALTALTPMVLVMNPAVPAANLKEFIALAKTQPERYAFASAGAGSPAHLAGEVLQRAAGIRLNHVPYKGGGQALADTVGGHTALFFSSMPSAMPLIKSGKLKAIAVSSANPVAAAPDIPAVAQAAGIDFDIVAWNGLFAPAGTPKAVIDKLNAVVTKALTVPEVQQRLASEGADTKAWTADEYGRFVRSETDKFAKIIKEANIKAD